MVRIYGIKNCSTMKKAFAWCEAHQVAYEFHDYKKLGAPQDRLMAWCQAVGWQALINTRGTTFRKLAEDRRQIDDLPAALRLMIDFPSLIKRPVVETADGRLLIGFDEQQFATLIPEAAQ